MSDFALELVVTYLIPYAVALFVALTLGFYALRRPEVPGTRVFALFCFSEGLWIAGYVGELFAAQLTGKLFWDSVQFLPSALAALCFLGFAWVYTGRRFKRPRWVGACVLVASLLFSALGYTDPLHGLMRRDPRLIGGVPFDALVYDNGPAMWAFYVVAVGAALAGLVLLFARLVRPGGMRRVQILVIMAAGLVPLAAEGLTLAGISFTFQRDSSPFSFTITGLVLAWGLFRLRVLDVVPIAREQALQTMGEAVIVLDGRYRLADMNAAAERLLGQAKERLIGRRAEDWPPEVSTLGELVQGVRDGSNEVALSKAGLRRYYDRAVTTQRDSRGRPIGTLIVLHEVTALRQAEQEARCKERELQTLNRALEAAQAELVRQARLAAMGELTGTLSHELRNPLGTVRNALFSLREAVEAKNEGRMRRSLELAERNVGRIDGMVNELLDFGRERELRREVLPIDELVRDLLAEQPVAEGIEVAAHLEAGASLSVDRESLRRAFRNVFENAVQALQSANDFPRRIEVCSRALADRVQISVRDTGAGIPQADLPRIFEPLFTTKRGGFGLGMAIVRKNMQQHGGDVLVESSVGAGTTVTLWLPVSGNEDGNGGHSIDSRG